MATMLRSRLQEEAYICCAFFLALAAMPVLAISYVAVGISKYFWLKLLSSRYPRLEFIHTDTVRSLLDTHRNQGIINVLLCVKGSLNTEQIRQKLIDHMLDRRDKSGELMFPRLRQLLVSCWGNYAWEANVLFRPENHFIVANPVYRGRPVTDTNIQDYVSDIVSKYFPPDQPSWQYIIIPVNAEDPKYYILVRVHHLLLTGKKSLNIGDMLFVEQSSHNETTSQREYIQQSPLAKLFPTPSAIPELWGKLNENLSNAWNEFISEYDPVESPRALKTSPGAFHVAALVLISAASALREVTRRSNGSGIDAALTIKSLLAALQRECKRRNLTVPKIVLSPLVTADPRKWPRRALSTLMTSITSTIKFPIRVVQEAIALTYLAKGRMKYSNTLTWRYGELIQLFVRALAEGWNGLAEVYRAPAKLWADTIGADDGTRHLLQTVNLCGRKVASWSRPIPRANIERAARALGVSSTDIALYGTTEALRALFEQAKADVPESVLITARAASEDFLFTFAEGQGKTYKKSMTGGMICLSLPVGATPRRICSVVQQACDRQRALAGAWAAQARCGALTRAVPSPFARLTLNLVSRRYAVSYAEITAPLGARERTTLWGQTVDHVIYWRPPQANISLSLTVVQYGHSVRLCVMTDARLSLAVCAPAQRWPKAIEQLVAKVDHEINKLSSSPCAVPQIVTSHTEPDGQDGGSNESNTLTRDQYGGSNESTTLTQEQYGGSNESNTLTQEQGRDEVDASTSTLKPPSVVVASPPPMRKF